MLKGAYLLQLRVRFLSCESTCRIQVYTHSYPTQLASRRLYFARDPLGRRSLLIHKPTPGNPRFLLASVSVGYNSEYEFAEVSTESMFCVDVLRLSNVVDVSPFRMN